MILCLSTVSFILRTLTQLAQQTAGVLNLSLHNDMCSLNWRMTANKDRKVFGGKRIMFHSYRQGVEQIREIIFVGHKTWRVWFWVFFSLNLLSRWAGLRVGSFCYFFLPLELQISPREISILGWVLVMCFNIHVLCWWAQWVEIQQELEISIVLDAENI